VDRTRAQRTLRAGLLAGAGALVVFGLAFYASILYIP
jgi:hypothetical protein